MAKRKDRVAFTTFSPTISGKAAAAIWRKIRRMRLHLRSDVNFRDIANMINTALLCWRMTAFYVCQAVGDGVIDWVSCR
ncbi:MAG: hypothetical protein ACRDRW_14075 [Pseudonocardiaceae bacterium]